MYFLKCILLLIVTSSVMVPTPKGHIAPERGGLWLMVHKFCDRLRSQRKLSLFYTRPWEPNGPKEVECKNSLHGILHCVLYDNKWMMFHGPSSIASSFLWMRWVVKQMAMVSNYIHCHWLLYILYCHNGTWTQDLVIINQPPPRRGLN